MNTALKCDQSYEAPSAVLSQGTTCFSAFLEILVNLTWPLLKRVLKLVEGLTFAKENQAADFEGKGTDICKKRELALNNTTVVIMKLSSLLKPILYMKSAAVLCVC